MGANVDDAIQGRAQAIELLQVSNSGKVFKVRRVSLGDAATVHVNAQDRSQGGTM